jgi:pyruvate/2-oxoacid:ferredoxin oxidoreductase alpha subunit
MSIELKNIPMPTNGSPKKIQPKYPRHKMKIMKGNFAAAEASKLCRVDFVPAYPITPQTTIIEEISAKVTRGEMDTSFINMESEHSVFAAAKGAAIAGARVFTATSGQGLFYAHEVLHAISHFRLPIVMCNVGRPSIPWNIWSDQSDSIAQRDTGWIQFYGESSQEVLDDIIQSYIISEKLDIPVMVVLDAFYQSHTSENIWIPDQDLVDEFLPPKKMKGTEIDIENPKSFGGLLSPEYYEDFNHSYWKDINQVEELTEEVGKAFGEHFGRSYGCIETFNIHENTKKILVTISSITSTARGVIRQHPDVGVLKIRLFKPFPQNSIKKMLKEKGVNPEACQIIAIDRNFTGDNEGAILQEMKQALYGTDYKLYGVYTGLGGKDVSPSTIEDIILTEFKRVLEVRWVDEGQ